ncbi:MAG: hypothetical protein KAT04_00465 [Methylococcales bacterium]|nr:hypothetical protein [Methylococcales bacterium]
MIEASYNLTLVVMSYLIAVLGSYVALSASKYISKAQGAALFWWLAAAALSLGGGAIWTMHFIGMLAYKMPLEFGFDNVLTVVSFVIAVVLVGAGLFIAGRGEANIVKLVVAGFVAALGVVIMHYMGMSAMILAADISYDAMFVGLSVLIAVVASIVALWIAFNLRGKILQIGSALVMGLAVCGMHYTGMAAATMTANGEVVKDVIKSHLSNEILGFVLFAVSGAVLFLIWFVTEVVPEEDAD